MSEVQHTWFREVATELGLPHADRIPEDPGSSPIECWETVQSVCGLGEAELLQALATHFDMEAVDPYQGTLSALSYSRRSA